MFATIYLGQLEPGGFIPASTAGFADLEILTTGPEQHITASIESSYSASLLDRHLTTAPADRHWSSAPEVT